jgi:hypothetical protein
MQIKHRVIEWRRKHVRLLLAAALDVAAHSHSIAARAKKCGLRYQLLRFSLALELATLRVMSRGAGVEPVVMTFYRSIAKSGLDCMDGPE